MPRIEIAAAVAFSTGTSWATMAILMPLVIPLTHTLAMDAGLGLDQSDNICLDIGNRFNNLAKAFRLPTGVRLHQTLRYLLCI